MDNASALYDRWQNSFRAYGRICATDPEKWHRPDTAEFRDLRDLLLSHAEAGDMLCQYALATILWMRLYCDSEEAFMTGNDEATPWWIAAAKQGCRPALDNLITSGVGPEADQARHLVQEVEKDRSDLVGWSHNMPVYGPEFIQEVCRRWSK